MAVLVTGGTGFIGSYVVLDLLAQGETPVLYDLQSPEAVPLLAPTRGLAWVRGDVRDRSSVAEAIAAHRPRAIIHLAGILQFGCRENPVLGTEVNILGLLNVLEGARTHGVKRVVAASSAAVYGPFSGEVRETDPISSTISLYGATKFYGEMLCQQYRDNYGLECACMRYYGVYGPGEVASPGMARVVKEIESTMTGKSVVIADAAAEDRFHFVYVADGAQATVLAALTLGAVSLTYNVAGGADSYTTFARMVETIRALCPTAGKVEFRGPGRARGSMDISRAKQELGYEPRYSLEDGLREVMKWHRDRTSA